MGSEVPFPFTPRPSAIMVPGMPHGAIACMPLMEDWGIASRLTSQQGFAGCFEGYLTDLARCWLEALDEGQRQEVQIFSCGPTPMMRASAQLAADFDIPCQVCLEEFMACAVGGCAGCAVRVRQDGTTAMRRVCVDGPVFSSNEVIWDALPH
jgi:dihydroorotate dehydrogenase electron transfer subunit